MTVHGGRSLAPPPVARAPGNRRALPWVLGSLALLLALLLGLVSLLLIGLETGAMGLAVGLVAALVPLPLYAGVILWVDRYEAEPAWMLAASLLWGATVALFVALVVNSVVTLLAGPLVATVVSAPVVEESAKGLALLILFAWRTDEFDGVLDSVVYAGMVALGFATVENVLFYGRAAAGGEVPLAAVVVLRGVISPLSHPLFTAMTGIGLGLARQSDHSAVKVLAPPLGLLCAIGLHAAWNLSAGLFGVVGFVLTYLVVMVPALAAVAVAVALALAREGRILRRHLADEVGRGLLSADEYERLASVRARLADSWWALRRGGWRAWRARADYHQAASELAFHRHRVARGLVVDPNAGAVDAAYLQWLRRLADRLRAAAG